MSKFSIVEKLSALDLNEAELKEVVGGVSDAPSQAAESVSVSSGYICSLSAECNSGGIPCNPLWW